jgi:hypothetical protein
MARINPMQPEPVRAVRDEMGNVIQKIYNPSVGTYDVVITTGPSYLTKRQEAVEAMANILQTSPQLWQVAGDLFIKNMDWPGAQEMAARFRKILDPKVLAEDDKSPELQSAEQMVEALTQQLNQAMGLIENVQSSMEAQEIKIKAYDAETKRISAMQNAMTPDQIQDIVMGTIAAAIETGDISTGKPTMPEPAPREMPLPPEMPLEGAPV